MQIRNKILVTGGFGFLGSHLIELLLADPNNQVHVVDNLSSNPLPLEDLLGMLGRPGHLTYSLMDVSDFCRTQTPREYREIYHLASVVGPAGVLRHAGRMAARILNDTMAVAELAMRCGARLLDVSTSEIYGGGQEGMCQENMDRVVPAKTSVRLEYAVGKLAAETALVNLGRARNLNSTIVRPFNIAGPRQSGRGGFVLPRFVCQALTNADITVFGDGAQIRAFTHAQDVAAGIILAMRRGPGGAIYNLGNPRNRCTVLELALEVRQLTDSQSRIVHVDPKAIYGPLYEEANNKFPDATRAMAELGWNPQYGRRQIVEQTVAFMKSLPERLVRYLQGLPPVPEQPEVRGEIDALAPAVR